MDNFLVVIEYFFIVLRQVYDLMISHWIFMFSLLLFVLFLCIEVIVHLRRK